MSLHDLSEKIEQYVVDIINGKKDNFFDVLFKSFLFILSRLYLHIVQIRRALYDNSVLKQCELGRIVISVGNLTTGGTGKTPVVELLAKTLAKKNRKVAILSRGYRSKQQPFLKRILAKVLHDDNAFKPKVVSNGKTVLLNSLEAGDEPYMLATNLLANRLGLPQGVAVLVDKDRVASGNYAITHFDVDTLILDDGFQYLRLHPHHNILLVDSVNRFHNHEMLPAGFLREPIQNLRYAQFIFMTKSKEGNKKLRHFRDFLRRCNPTAVIIECAHQPKYLQSLDTQENMPLTYLKGKKVAALSAIAAPKSFMSYLKQYGANIVYEMPFVDHHRFKDNELKEFYQNARDREAELLVTTEKDAVRISIPTNSPIPFYFLRIEIGIIQGNTEFNDYIQKIILNN